MTTETNAVAATAYNQSSFDSSQFASFMQKGHRFKLDLAGRSLIGVLEAYETFKQRMSPHFTNLSIRNKIASLQSLLNDQQIMPDDVTDEFYVYFHQFLLSGSKQVKPSTIENYFSNIRSALGWASKHNCKVSETFNVYKVENYEKEKVVLSPEQISHIYHYDIDKNHEEISALAKEHNIHRFSFSFLKKVRDHFVLSCNLGQRFSDAKKIEPSMFDDTKTIFKTTQQKTGGKATVYLPKYSITLKIVYEILNKYDYCSPITQDISNYNKMLHLLLHAIGGEFNETIVSRNKISGEIVEERVPIWKAVTSHTARRTFASYGLTHGMTIPQIQKCTGHKDLRALSKYVILSDMD